MEYRPLKIKIKRVNEKTSLPVRSYPTDSGLDLFSTIEKLLHPKEIGLIPTGISIEIPEYPFSHKTIEAQVRPRSGLSLNHGITVLNTPGTIDNSYRGEIKIILINLSEDDFYIVPGSKIAQLVFTEVFLPEIQEVEQLTPTKRNDNGFGSSGQ